jgi:DNA gyrase subunit B
VERGHIYIAQPPLYKVKAGKEELYLKDAGALDSFLLRIALINATVHTGGEHGSALSGDTLAELARKHQVAQAVIARLGAFMDAEALRALADGVALNLDTLADAEISAAALQSKLPDAEVAGEFDVRNDKPILRISRRHHGNVKSSVLTQDFVHGADYAALAEAARTFKDLLSVGARVTRGEGERMKEEKVGDFRHHGAPALQGPGRNEPGPVVGNHHGPDRAAPAARADRRRHRSRPSVHHAHGR